MNMDTLNYENLSFITFPKNMSQERRELLNNHIMKLTLQSEKIGEGRKFLKFNAVLVRHTHCEGIYG